MLAGSRHSFARSRSVGKAFNNESPVSVQEDIDGLLLCFQPKAGSSLPVSRYAEICDVGTGFHGQKIAETARGVNYKPSFATYTPPDMPSKNVPLNMISKWMRHSQMETTAIYANTVGEEQQSIAARMWT